MLPPQVVGLLTTQIEYLYPVLFPDVFVFPLFDFLLSSLFVTNLDLLFELRSKSGRNYKVTEGTKGDGGAVRMTGAWLWSRLHASLCPYPYLYRRVRTCWLSGHVWTRLNLTQWHHWSLQPSHLQEPHRVIVSLTRFGSLCGAVLLHLQCLHTTRPASQAFKWVKLAVTLVFRPQRVK